MTTSNPLDELREAEALLAKGEQAVVDATNAIVRLDRELGNLGADLLAGRADQAAVDAKDGELDAAMRDVERANKTVAALKERLTKAQAAAKAAGRDRYMKILRKKLDKRSALAERYSDLEAERAKIWQEFHDVAVDIVASWPGSLPQALMTPAILDKGSLRTACEAEAYKQSGNPDMLGGNGLLRPSSAPTMPGGRVSLLLTHSPELAPAIVDEIHKANDLLIRTMSS